MPWYWLSALLMGMALEGGKEGDSGELDAVRGGGGVRSVEENM